MKFVDIETPYNGNSYEIVKRNIRYVRACVRDSILRGEIPFASHLFFTQGEILDDNLSGERERGIKAGKALIQKLKAPTVAYTDLGISKGMQLGIEMAQEDGRGIEYRSLGSKWEEEFLRGEEYRPIIWFGKI